MIHLHRFRPFSLFLPICFKINDIIGNSRYVFSPLNRVFKTRIKIRFVSLIPLEPEWPTQPPIQWVREALSLRVKQSGREADHSPPSSADVNNAWSYTFTPQYVFVAWCLVKHWDNFTFTFYRVQTASASHPTSSAVVIGGSLPGG
jgi:hypothetical protein